MKPANPNTVCRDFAFNGYCEKGFNCDALHAFDCPDFYENGRCERLACRLKHKDKPIEKQLNVVDKDEGTVNTLQLANSLFTQPDDSESDSDCESFSEESSKNNEGEVLDDDNEEDGKILDFIKL